MYARGCHDERRSTKCAFSVCVRRDNCFSSELIHRYSAIIAIYYAVRVQIDGFYQNLNINTLTYLHLSRGLSAHNMSSTIQRICSAHVCPAFPVIAKRGAHVITHACVHTYCSVQRTSVGFSEHTFYAGVWYYYLFALFACVRTSHICCTIVRIYGIQCDNFVGTPIERIDF